MTERCFLDLLLSTLLSCQEPRPKYDRTDRTEVHIEHILSVADSLPLAPPLFPIPTPPREEIIHHILHKYRRATSGGETESLATPTAATNCSAESEADYKWWRFTIRLLLLRPEEESTGKRIVVGTWFNEISRESQAEQLSIIRSAFHQTRCQPA